MVRISDGRMSGTAAGTVVLHVSPETTVGGTLAVVQSIPWILFLKKADLPMYQILMPTTCPTGTSMTADTN